MYQFIYSPVALIEYKDAVVWYKERSTKVAEGSVNQVQEKVNNICKTPYRYHINYKHFRETSLRKYPYSLVYFIDENEKTVIITSIFHQKRNPKKKYVK